MAATPAPTPDSISAAATVPSEREAKPDTNESSGQDAAQLELTPEERTWLRAHPQLYVAFDVDWPPVEFADAEIGMNGIAADYLQQVSALLEIRLKPASPRSWQAMLTAVRVGNVDFFSALTPTPERREWLNFTASYLSFPVVIVTRSNISYVGSIDDLKGKTVTVVEGYASHELLQRHHKRVKLLPTRHIREGLTAVSSGQAFAFVGSLATVSHVIRREGLTNLKISGDTPYRFELAMAVPKGNEVLLRVLDKALAAITAQQRDAIYDKWISVSYDHASDYGPLWQILGMAFLALLIILYWNRKLARLNRALAHSGAVLRAIVESTREGILVVDNRRRMIYANSRFAEMWGISKELLQAQDDNQLLFHVKQQLLDPDGFLDKVEKLQQTQKVSLDAIYFRDGRIFDRYSRPLLQEKQLIGRVWSFSDVTQSKRIEEALKRAKESAEQANQAKSLFVANMSHEIRTPMNAILGLVHLALRTQTNPKQQDYLTKIDRSARWLLDIIDDVLDFSKIEAGKLTLDHIPFGLEEIINQLHNVLGLRAADKGLAFSINVDDDVPRHLVGDPGRLGQVLINLVGNAVKFTAQGEVAIRVQVEMAKSSAEEVVLIFSVRDTGIGISAENQAYLFREFSQVDVSVTRRFGGTGLGLAISKRLVEEMGGQIVVESILGDGSEFILTIPFERQPASSQPLAHQPPDKQRSARQPVAAPPEFQRARILLVEDNKINQQVAQELLEEVGLDVTIANHGGEAVEWLKRENVDLVLMDIQMPEMDGYQAALLIRRDLGLETLPIIAMTAYVTTADQERCLAVGMNGYIPKPIDLNILYQTLAQWLKLKAAGEPSQTIPRPEPVEADKELLYALPGIDAAMGLCRVRHNRSVFYKLLLDFREDYAQASVRIRQCLDEGDKQQAQRLLHTLKGAAGNLGADELFHTAADLETALRAGAEHDHLHQRFARAMKTVIEGLALLAAEQSRQEASVVTLQSSDFSTLKPLLEELSRRLRHGCFDASTCLAEIKTTLGQDCAELWEVLETQVAAFEFEQAEATVQQLIRVAKSADRHKDYHV